MTVPKSALELIVADAVQQVTDRANAALAEVVGQINANPGLPNLPAVELQPPNIIVSVPESTTDTKTDALSRAGRSFVGGAIVTVIATVGTEITKLATSGAFDPLDGSSWKTGAVGLVGALGYAGVAYVQRFFFPPKV